jgi:hypothetical protein
VISDPVGDFEALSARQRQAVALVEYQCRATDPCRLLTIWQAHGERFWYTPKYKITEAVAIEETAESARAKRTDDGMRRWKARAGSLDELLEFADGFPADKVGQFVNCKHLRNHYISWCDLERDAEDATVGSPTWVSLP